MPTAIPMISTVSDVDDPTGSQWLGMASSESADMTAVPASSSGMPAAISAPKTISSSTSVTGTDVSSALRKSWLSKAFAARSALASPASAISSSGFLAWMAATARSAGPTAVSCRATGPGTVNVTSTER